jgi:four helix bundle protein
VRGVTMKEHRTSNIEHPTSNQEGARKVFDLEERLLNFAVAIIDTCESLPKTRSGNHVAGQLLRSGTSPYSNHGEAESAESPDDFIHKIKICLKELRETRRWLRLVERKQWLPGGKELVFALSEVEELIRIFVASIRTAERNRLQRPPAQRPPKPPTSH